LPEVQFADGCAEVIKYAVLEDSGLFAHLEEAGTGFDRAAVIAGCVAQKAELIAQDEFDRGSRMLLNLGHTIGHGVEAKSNFAISHGKAVAIGMAIVSRAAAANGFCTNETKDEILSVLERFELPITTAYSAGQLYTSALSDKKRSGGTVNLIIPEAIGSCAIVPTAITDLESFIQAGL
jgi:3-dehydroquinate synthase